MSPPNQNGNGVGTEEFTMVSMDTTEPGHDLLGQTQGLMTNGHSDRSHEVGEINRMPFMMMLLRKRLHYLPIFTAVFIICSFFISYIIAVVQGSVEPFFPYISYTAINAPERCVFSQLVNFGALLMAANIYIRYKQMKEVLRLLSATRRDWVVNKSALIVGIISAFGLSIVANFQTVEMRAVHYIGAGLAFVLGMIYCWLQTSLSVRYCRWSCVAISQLINSIVLTLSLVIFTISKIIYKVRLGRGEGTKFDVLREVYLVSTISEWLTAASIVTFVLTFYRDFSRVRLRLPTVTINDQNIVLQDFRVGSLSTPGSASPRQNGAIHAV